MTRCIEHRFDAIGNAPLVVDPNQRFLHSVLFEIQFPCDFAVVQTLGYQTNRLFLARREHHLTGEPIMRTDGPMEKA